MTIREGHKRLVTELLPIYDEREAANIAGMALEYITGLGHTERILHRDLALTEAQLKLLNRVQLDLLKHKPIQYILQEAWFSSLKFYVNEHVLIPRPETEELIEWVAGDILTKADAVKTLLDIGSGSGCIPISLKKRFPGIRIDSVDISPDALIVANKNAHSLGTQINFWEADFLNEEKWDTYSKYDIIISNPPYIKASESVDMQKNVLDHEPHQALFVPDTDSLVFYRKIAAFGKRHLTEHGSIYLEINASLSKETIEVYHAANYQTELRKDMYGKERMIRAINRIM